MASSSEIDVDPSILEQVQQAISRVAEIQAEPETDDDDGLLALPQQWQRMAATATAPSEVTEELLERRRHKLEDQVASLEAEIKLLEEQVAVQESSGGGELDLDAKLESAILSLVGGPEAVGEQDGAALLSKLVKSVDTDEHKRMKHFQSQIRLSEALSGVKFTSVNWKVKHNDDGILLREHTHIGTVMDYHFKVVFIVSEDNSENCDSKGMPDHARIVDFKVEVDPRAKVEMAPFLDSSGSAVLSDLMDLDLIGFYQTYTRYCLLHKERSDTFTEAKSRFADRAQLAEGPSGFRLYLTNRKGLRLNFSWKLIVSPQGNIERFIRFQAKTPANASDEVRETLAGVPQLLEKMIISHGHRGGFLKLLSLFDPSVPESEHES